MTTRSREYTEQIVEDFKRRFSIDLQVTLVGPGAYQYVRTDGKKLRKQHIAYIDGYATAAGRSQFGKFAAQATLRRVTLLMQDEASKAKAVGIRNALLLTARLVEAHRKEWGL